MNAFLALSVGEPAFAHGIGEALRAFSMPSIWFVVLTPRVEVSTATIFAARELTRHTPSAKISVFSEAYGGNEISERHRHRYEVNNEFREALEKHGLVLSGLSPDKQLVEMIELSEHPYFVACQFHPEFKSKPLEPHPLFREFIVAGYKNRLTRGAEAPAQFTTALSS